MTNSEVHASPTVLEITNNTNKSFQLQPGTKYKHNTTSLSMEDLGSSGGDSKVRIKFGFIRGLKNSYFNIHLRTM